MTNFKQLFEHETIQDIVLFLSGRNEEGIAHPRLDGYTTTFSNGLISNIELIKIVKIMSEQGLISSNKKGGYKKGPLWKEPKFLTEKKYGIK
ncbi:hypothetical protein [Rahnella ecdela]|uniref:Uncharacterized protein n=1 Tax=Rahnella ecdela TaxID=2816250 RepID=A0ABS6LBI7_9GAMM|nr:hypothetical protein [Rahnella ecdela]MBU9843962.1 hypothetical protein [Rahnella ecdela]